MKRMISTLMLGLAIAMAMAGCAARPPDSYRSADNVAQCRKSCDSVLANCGMRDAASQCGGPLKCENAADPQRCQAQRYDCSVVSLGPVCEAERTRCMRTCER